MCGWSNCFMMSTSLYTLSRFTASSCDLSIILIATCNKSTWELVGEYIYNSMYSLSLETETCWDWGIQTEIWERSIRPIKKFETQTRFSWKGPFSHMNYCLPTCRSSIFQAYNMSNTYNLVELRTLPTAEIDTYQFTSIIGVHGLLIVCCHLTIYSLGIRIDTLYPLSKKTRQSVR